MRGLVGGRIAGVRVANLRGELGAVHLLVDDLRVLADFAPEGGEGGFEFDFRHCGSALFSLVPCEGFRLLIGLCHSKDGAKVLLFLQNHWLGRRPIVLLAVFFCIFTQS